MTNTLDPYGVFLMKWSTLRGLDPAVRKTAARILERSAGTTNQKLVATLGRRGAIGFVAPADGHDPDLLDPGALPMGQETALREV